ncbi:zinc metallopeptidase [Sulfurospirillum sp. T05]|uniref:Zinc metallopeptidase n=1 Tax=Sulfurospirillum tamanense TaxID=2813362 RepID=A0ABS2WUD9_9BACT|nr:zincin-like metallopeptidase domain-containing protein [Sulfurospirillum tamanensis]MBN2965256.1 zinc metallopeptidase [Sulfurospirillum tamanensis]
MSKSFEQYEKYIEQIAEHFYKAIQENNVPWEREWTARELQEGAAHNPITKTVYQGMNTLSLDTLKLEKGYASNAWLTYKQAKDLGAHVRKGEKSAAISFFKFDIKTEEQTVKDNEGKERVEEKEVRRPIFKQSYVFNIDQIDGLSQEQRKELMGIIKDEILPTKQFATHEQCEKILQNSGISIRHIPGEKAYYSPTQDEITLPEKVQFKNEGAYYSTALHELGHATGHESRLDRKFGHDRREQEYAKEELRAEIYSYLQAKELGIAFNLQNHESYVKSWARNLENQKEQIVEAVKDAVKIVSYVKENYMERSQERTKELTLEQKKELAIKGQARAMAAHAAKSISR